MNDRIYPKYVWGDRQASNIKSISLSFGDLPIYNIDIGNGSFSIYKTINGSRDGWMSFPDGYFGKKTRSLVSGEFESLLRALDAIDFTIWNTDEATIRNIEEMSDGYCAKRFFKCVFEDDTVFVCANPPQKQFGDLIEQIKRLFHEEVTEPFSFRLAPELEQTTVLNENYAVDDSEYVYSDRNITTALYSDVLRLTFENSGKTVQFQKPVIEVGRSKECDLLLDGKATVARHQATFFYEKRDWFLRDNYSTNGTWLNGVKIQPGKKYHLAADDELNFAMAEKFIFYKTGSNVQSAEESDAKAVSILETGMALFAKSGYTDETALKIIISALTYTPLYFPVEIDTDAPLWTVESAKLGAEGTLQLPKDVKVQILSLSSDRLGEFVPMFTSTVEMNKEPSASIMKFYPEDYLHKIVEMDKDIIINPLNENKFFLSKRLLTDVLLLFAQSSAISQTGFSEEIISFEDHKENGDGKTMPANMKF